MVGKVFTCAQGPLKVIQMPWEVGNRPFVLDELPLGDSNCNILQGGLEVGKSFGVN
jgi:hypothetical protein